MNEKHALERKKASNMYAMSSLVSYEPFVDKVNGEFMAALAGHAQHGQVFDLFPGYNFTHSIKVCRIEERGKLEYSAVNNVIGANIGAGSDTTGISMSAVIYFLMKHPDCLQKLRDEIETAAGQGNLLKPVTFQGGQKLSCLQATNKEALGLQAQILSRVVPEGGSDIAGRHFSQGAGFKQLR
ncbi:hypothetical protein PENFLA_c038G00986 [Penicillium flavigenum]|uniref:Cytochrome P450 n=1 Tax=Penicillium flavigenum TaxID=254877 RepID=A0A1V6SK53_9EURO|nr:hypothetical protein PENFLA_c038G00986 [Penicillium flavigenum]